MSPEETRLRDEFVQIIRPWFEVAMNSAIPEPWDVSEHCAARAADAILIRLRGEADYHRARAERLAEVLLGATASLVAATSLLERGGKRAAPSDKMFAQMLADYRAAAEVARQALAQVDEG